MNPSIDIVIPWVDANDPEWQQEKRKYAGESATNTTSDSREVRFRDWDTVKYLFRSIEMYMPWVRKVFFITYGHLPKWMNTNCEKLRIINHKEYIPPQYLPTFSSHTIELNLHRISELSETFVYFNDDLLVLRPTQESDFFIDGIPRDYAILNPITTSRRFSIQDIALTNVEVINDHFSSKVQMKDNFRKWFAPCYGKYLYRNISLSAWPYFVGFLNLHQGNAYLKSTFSEVWRQEYDILNTTCMHRFRTRRDVNQWIMRYWQLAEGRFIPIKPYGLLYNISNDNKALFDVLPKYKGISICINDNNIENIQDFDSIQKELTDVLEKRFPLKSSFEV